MSSSERLPIEENMRIQRATWTIERIGWGLFGLIVSLALLGLFGNGILSWATATHPDAGITIDYQRFQRVTALTRFDIQLSDAADDELRLRLDPKFQTTYEVEGIEPRPMRSSSASSGLEFTFEPAASGPLPVVIWARPREFGPVTLQASTGRGQPLSLWILVYP